MKASDLFLACEKLHGETQKRFIEACHKDVDRAPYEIVQALSRKNYQHCFSEEIVTLAVALDHLTQALVSLDSLKSDEDFDFETNKTVE